eukprot:5874481-Heterocapsa_arctica.AAC.1
MSGMCTATHGMPVSNRRQCGSVSELDNFKLNPHENFIGNLYIKDHPIKEIIEFIDWTPFFQIYQLRG